MIANFVQNVLFSMYYHAYRFYNKDHFYFDGIDVRFEAVWAISAFFSFILHNTISLMMIFWCVKMSKWISIANHFIIYYYLNKFYSGKRFKNILKKREDHLIKWQFILLSFILMILYNFIAPILWSKMSKNCFFLDGCVDLCRYIGNLNSFIVFT